MAKNKYKNKYPEKLYVLVVDNRIVRAAINPDLMLNPGETSIDVAAYCFAGPVNVSRTTTVLTTPIPSEKE